MDARAPACNAPPIECLRCALALLIAWCVVLLCSGCAPQGLREPAHGVAPSFERRAPQIECVDLLRQHEPPPIEEPGRPIEGLAQLLDEPSKARAHAERERRALEELTISLGGRVRELASELADLRRELAPKGTPSRSNDVTIAELQQRIYQLGASISSHRAQIASIESERTRLAERLAATRRNRATIAGVLTLLLVASVVLGFVPFERSWGFGATWTPHGIFRREGGVHGGPRADRRAERDPRQSVRGRFGTE